MALPVLAAKPRVHLWVFNHPFRGITEQVEFFCATLRGNGYAVTVSTVPSAHALNVVIESFSPATAPRLVDFCRRHGKRVGVILTEHIDFHGSAIDFNCGSIDAGDEYMDSATKMGRMFSLLTLAEHIRCFFRLGDLPRLENFRRMVPGIPVRTLPFPPIQSSNRSFGGSAADPAHDLVFTGQVTEHRARLLARLRAQYDVVVSRGWMSRRCRDGLNASGKLVLNVPQHSGWKWISTMRVLAALRCGRATVSMGRFEPSTIGRFCLLVGEEGARGGELRGALDKYMSFARKLLDEYNLFVRSPQNGWFPDEEFDLWARLEL